MPSGDDRDLEEFAQVVAHALKEADPIPDQVKQLSRLAIEFQGISTPDMHDTPMGVRSSSERISHIAHFPDVTLSWEQEGAKLVGFCSNDTVSLKLHTPESMMLIKRDVDDSSFECVHPKRPYRFILERDGQRWATGWLLDA